MNASQTERHALVTGAAGFIGAHLVEALLKAGWQVTGYDDLNPYYDPALKTARLDTLGSGDAFRFERGCLTDRERLDELFVRDRPALVYHLAAQAGVRWSIDHPHAYADANLTGFLNVLECCRHHGPTPLVFASSSSVYGSNSTVPFREDAPVDHPVSLYAATKRADELLAHSYAHLYRIPTTGLRLFTVYGPWGRPDMAPMLFARAIRRGEPIQVFNEGAMQRDFTYVGDIVDGILRAGARPPTGPTGDNDRPDRSTAPFRIYNLGRGEPVQLMDFISLLEKHLGRKAEIRYRAMQPGDMVATWCDSSRARDELGFEPSVDLDAGIGRFVAWFRSWDETQA